MAPPKLDARSWPRCDLGFVARGPGGRLGVLPDHPAKLSSKGPPPTFTLVAGTARDLAAAARTRLGEEILEKVWASAAEGRSQHLDDVNGPLAAHQNKKSRWGECRWHRLCLLLV